MNACKQIKSLTCLKKVDKNFHNEQAKYATARSLQLLCYLINMLSFKSSLMKDGCPKLT